MDNLFQREGGRETAIYTDRERETGRKGSRDKRERD